LISHRMVQWATCLSHLSKDRRAEKVTPISVTPQGNRRVTETQ
jgi:hypothetical protein